MNAIASIASAGKSRSFDGDDRLSYQRKLVAFMTLMRTGTALYKIYAESLAQFSPSAPSGRNAAKLLVKVAGAVEDMAVSSLGMTAEKAKKIADLMLTTSGDLRQTPIEAAITAWATEGARYRELLELSKPKPPSVEA